MNQDHSVIVHFTYDDPNLDPFFEIQTRLEAAITEANVGMFDGNEIADEGGEASLYMYGPDADRLFEVVEPILKSVDFLRGAEVVITNPSKEDPQSVRTLA